MKRFLTLFTAVLYFTLTLSGFGALAYTLPGAPNIICGDDGVLIGCDTENKTVTAPSAGDFNNQVASIVSLIITVLAIVAVVFVVKGGITLIFSLGNEERRKSAVRTVIYALIGLVVAILAFTIVSVISDIRIF